MEKLIVLEEASKSHEESKRKKKYLKTHLGQLGDDDEQSDFYFRSLNMHHINR